MKSFKQFVFESASSEFDQKRKALSSHYKGFSKEERNSIKAYTGQAALNEYIHTHIHGDKPRYKDIGGKWDDDTKKEYDQHIGHMDSTLSKHKTPIDMHTYAAVRFDPRKTENNTYHSKGYFSSSISYPEARRFSSGAFTGEKATPHIIKLKVPKGSPGAYVRKYSDPEFAHQEEFISPRGTKIRYTGKSYEHNGKMIHECELDQKMDESVKKEHGIQNMQHNMIYDLKD